MVGSEFPSDYAPHGFPRWLSSKESTCNEGDMGLIPQSGRSPEGGHGNPLQHIAWRIPMDRGAWWATVHGASESDTTEQQTQINYKRKWYI